jgi:hypothetical protein
MAQGLHHQIRAIDHTMHPMQVGCILLKKNCTITSVYALKHTTPSTPKDKSLGHVFLVQCSACDKSFDDTI